MMKLLFQLCFLALATSAVSEEIPPTTIPPATPAPETSTPSQLNDTKTGVDVNKNATDNFNASTPKMDVNRTTEETKNASMPTPSPTMHQRPTSPSVTTQKVETGEGSTSAATTASAAVAAGGSSWAYILLVLIIIVIIVLCVILYMLRRASRTYSFDLQRPPASSSAYEPTGTFGQVYLDDLDQPANKDVISDDLSTTPVPNGTGPKPEENTDGEENALQDPPEVNDPQRSSSPSSSSSSSSSLSGGDQAEKKSNQMSSNNLFFDAVEETQPQQQNGNNNNPSVCSSDPFVEINLDDPAWSDQLLSPPPTSSVLPFSSFSFSSSSSSS
ncbi:PREDICTED: putative protein TPRXL isoform X1 [Poecilia mexicana]|uniref:putative protein TPRXL isoform X1 n=1 Tax=Poecilia mexicana TaxID=48701 RepID=UPI00072E2D05|nr:PREDICTED: putative protein TPRXL isoform X1 [Poecilia mexicana]